MAKNLFILLIVSLIGLTGCSSTSTAGAGGAPQASSNVNGQSEAFTIADNTIKLNPNETINNQFSEGLLPNEFVNGERINHNFLPVYFAYDSANIESSENSKLKMLAGFLESNANLFLIVEGFCDERGSEEYNRALSERRALAIKSLLESAAPSIQARINTVGYGEERPADPAATPEAYAKNRRAEFIIISKR